MLRVVLFI